MTKQDDYSYIRFLLVYRQEPRDLPGAEPLWRGWIQRIPGNAEAMSKQADEPARIWFSTLEEIPKAIRRLQSGS